MKNIKELNDKELFTLSEDIRQKIISTVSLNGGHLSSNLGVVELTIAIHKAFDLPKDKVIFDVSHQTYTHKILTGREEDFTTLRQFGGISGFSNPNESEYDHFSIGHSSFRYHPFSIGSSMRRARWRRVRTVASGMRRALATSMVGRF